MAEPYRDYVVRALNTNKPFDQFVVEQIAGDILAGAGSGERHEDQLDLLAAPAEAPATEAPAEAPAAEAAPAPAEGEAAAAAPAEFTGVSRTGGETIAISPQWTVF